LKIAYRSPASSDYISLYKSTTPPHKLKRICTPALASCAGKMLINTGYWSKTPATFTFQKYEFSASQADTRLFLQPMLSVDQGSEKWG